jgi:antitoxin CptB
MSDDLTTRRKRLTFRSWHRGTQEADLLLGNFADQHLPDMDSTQLDHFEVILDQPDPVVYQWFTGESQPPDHLNHDVMQLLLNFRYRPEKP